MGRNEIFLKHLQEPEIYKSQSNKTNDFIPFQYRYSNCKKSYTNTIDIISSIRGPGYTLWFHLPYTSIEKTDKAVENIENLDQS